MVRKILLLLVVLVLTVGVPLFAEKKEKPEAVAKKLFEGMEVDAALQSLPSTTFLTEKLPEFEGLTSLSSRD